MAAAGGGSVQSRTSELYRMSLAAVRSPLRLPLHLAVLLVGIAALLIPTLISLGREYWSTDNGVHGPLILVSGVWLIWRERDRIRLRPGSIGVGWLLTILPLLLVVYAYGRVFDVLPIESAALYAILVLLGFYYWGPKVMRRLWFALLYLAFLIKPPFTWIAELTQPLKIWLSGAAVSILHAFGYPVGNTGVTIQIAQYELLVQQACAGLGSIFSLFAMGLLYLHLTNRRPVIHSAILLLAILPLAILANLVRVIGIMLLTYYGGNALGQSSAHELMGLITFALAILGMFVLDKLLDLTRGLNLRRRRRPRQRARRSPVAAKATIEARAETVAEPGGRTGTSTPTGTVTAP
jgi:exosortase